jgi:hypothetical protein
MAVAEEKTSPETTEKSWHGIVLQTLKRNDIRLVPYVPDRVLTPLIKNLHADPFFTTFATAREEEAVGIVSGAWMGGMRSAVLMQTSGFATLRNVLASLAIPYQIPLIMFVSERGTLGEFNYGPVAGVPHHAPGAGFARDGAPHRDKARRVRVHRRPLHQAGHHHAGAGGADPLAAFDRRQSLRQVSDLMSNDNPARNTKVMNRFDLTSRLIAKLKHEEAVIGGIGNTNFDLWAAGHRPQNFYMLGSMGLAFPIALGVALAQPDRRVFALEGDGSLLMQLGSLSTIATLAPKEPHHGGDGQRHLPDHRRATDAGRRRRRHRRHRRRERPHPLSWAADEDDFERLIEESMSAAGPTLIGVRIDDKPGTGTTRRDPVQIRERFMHGMGVREPL